MVEQRKCSTCSGWYSLDWFNRDTTQASGYRSQCRGCSRESGRASRMALKARKNIQPPPPRVRTEPDREATLEACKNWRGWVNDGPLVATIGRAA